MSNKVIAKNALFLYVRMAIVMIVSIYVSRVVLEQLGETDYGVYNVVGGVVGMVMSFNSAFAFGTQRFASYYIGKNDISFLSKVFSAAFLIHCVLALFIAVLLATLGSWFINSILNIPSDRIVSANTVFHVSILTASIAIIQVPFSAFIIAHEKMNIYAYISLIDAAVKLFIAYSLSRVACDKLIFYGVMLLLSQILQIIFCSLYCRKNFRECRGVIVHNDKKLYEEMLKYSGWNFFGTFGYMLSDQGINMILNVFFGPAVNAARAIALQVKSAVNQFILNLQTAFNPQMVKLYAEGSKDAMLLLLYDNIKLSLLLMWFILQPLFLELDFLLKIWLVDVPKYTLVFARITLVKLFLVCLEQPFIAANGATGYNKVFTLVSSIFLASTLPISYVALLFVDDPSVVFFIDILLYLILVIWKIFYLKNQIGLSVEILWQRSIKPIINMALISSPFVVVLSYYIDNQVLNFFAVCIISVLINGFIAWTKILSGSTKNIILAKLKIKN